MTFLKIYKMKYIEYLPLNMTNPLPYHFKKNTGSFILCVNENSFQVGSEGPHIIKISFFNLTVKNKIKKSFYSIIIKMEVKPYTHYSGKIVNIGNHAYNVNNIPKELTLVGNSIDEETEDKLIELIKGNKSIQIKTVMSCIAKDFSVELPHKLNDFYWSVLNPGEGMPPEMEDYKYYNPCVVVINLGSDIEMTFVDTKTRKQYPVMLPRRSMFLLKDTEKKFQRLITKKFEDKVSDGTMSKREHRYALVFKSLKI